MSPATAMRRTDPRRFDRFVSWAAMVARDCAPGPAKQYAAAMGISRSRASRHLNGSDPYSPVTDTLIAFDRLARSDKTKAIPLLREAFAVVNQAEIENATDEELRARLQELIEVEHGLEASENRATTQYLVDPTNLDAAEAAERAHARKADAHVESMLIYRELRARKERS